MLTIFYRRPTRGARRGLYDPEADALRTIALSFNVKTVTEADGGMISVTGDPYALAAFLLEVRAAGIEHDHITVIRGLIDSEAEARFRGALGDWGEEIAIVAPERAGQAQHRHKPK